MILDTQDVTQLESLFGSFIQFIFNERNLADNLSGKYDSVLLLIYLMQIYTTDCLDQVKKEEGIDAQARNEKHN